MTDEEKLAEEYVKSVIDVNAFDWKIVREIYLAFLEGLKAGRPEWHDLRKNPKDLPTKNCECLCNIRPKQDENERFTNDDFRGVLFFVNGKFLLDEDDKGCLNDTTDYTELVIAWKEIVPPKESE